MGRSMDREMRAYVKMMGLREDFTRDELRRAYLRGCRKLAPDKGGDADRFAALQRANAALETYARDEARESGVANAARPEPAQLTAAPNAGKRHANVNAAYAALYGDRGPAMRGHGEWLKTEIPKAERPPERVSEARLNETFERIATARGYGPGAVSTHVVGANETGSSVAHAIHDASDDDFTLGRLPDLRTAFRGAL